MQKKIVFVRHFFEVTGCFEPVVKPLFHIIKYDETFGKVKVRTIEINIVSLLDIWNINLTPSFPICDQLIHHFWSICFKVISPVKSSSNFQPLKIASLAFTNAHHFERRFNPNFQIKENFSNAILCWNHSNTVIHYSLDQWFPNFGYLTMLSKIEFCGQ